MRFSPDIDATKHVIQSYGPGWVTINEQEIRRSLIVTPEKVVTDWPPQTFAELEDLHFEAIVRLDPEIVLLGTGSRQRFPAPRLMSTLAARGIGVDIMGTAAACRTYNIIMLEGRRVAAALLLAD